MSWSCHDPRAASLAVRIAGALWLAGLAVSTAAADTVPRLQLDTRALASENPLLLPGSDRQAVLLEVSARPGINWTNATGSSFDLGAVITDRGYTRRYGNFVVGRVDAKADYRDSEYLSIGGSASFSRDLSLDLLTSSVEAAADPSSVRTAYSGAVSVTWHPDEYSWIRPEASFERSRFTETGLLNNTRAFSGSLSYSRRTGERTKIGVRAGAIFSTTRRLSDVSTQLLYATIEQQLSAGWRATGELGVERNSSRIEELLGERVEQPSRTLLSGRGELCRDAPGPAICVAASLNTEVSGLGGLQRRAVVSASLDQRLSERTSIEVDAEYQRAVMQGSVFPTFDAIRAVATLQRSLTRDLRLGGTIQYLRRRLIDGRRIGAAFAGLQLTFTPSLR